VRLDHTWVTIAESHLQFMLADSERGDGDLTYFGAAASASSASSWPANSPTACAG
jgi:hypothetical protein